jgi:hypothetical protein
LNWDKLNSDRHCEVLNSNNGESAEAGNMEDNPYQSPSVEQHTPFTFRAVIVCGTRQHWKLIWFLLMSIYPLIFIYIGIVRITIPVLRYENLVRYIPFNLVTFMANGLLVTIMPLFSKWKPNTRLIMMVLGFMVWIGLIFLSGNICIHLIDYAAKMR